MIVSRNNSHLTDFYKSFSSRGGDCVQPVEFDTLCDCLDDEGGQEPEGKKKE